MTSSSAVFLLTLLLVIWSGSHVESLQSNFYAKSCPNAESTIASIVRNAVKNNPRAGAVFIRLLFHDCFVRGCDASILIDKSSKNAEKDAVPNQSLHDLNIIDQIKAVIEKLCPKTVSCADIVAFTAATSLSTLGGPTVDMQGGRFDGLVSNMNEANGLPSPFSPVSTLISNFASKGLSVNDMVTLSGAHTIGQSHCSSFSGRLRNFNPTSPVDPSLNSQYAKTLQKQCPVNVASSKTINMDPLTSTSFDNGYYKDVIANKGLFQSDAALLNSAATKAVVNEYAGNNADFLRKFGAALVKMGKIGVKTKGQGNIRSNCRSIA